MFAKYEQVAKKQLPMALLYGWSIVDRAKGDFPGGAGATAPQAPIPLLAG